MSLLSNIVNSLMQLKNKSFKQDSIMCKINTSLLPSQGVFYDDDFTISLKYPRSNDIEFLNKSFETSEEKGFLNVAEIMKSFIQKNIVLSKNHVFEDILSIDITMIFIIYYNNIKKEPLIINNQLLSSDNFMYFDFGLYKKNYNQKEKNFEFNGFKYSPPTIRVENALYDFIDYIMTFNSDEIDYANSDFNFIFFMNKKTKLECADIINLINLFTFELSNVNKLIVENIISKFNPLMKYSFKTKSGDLYLMCLNDLSQVRI